MKRILAVLLVLCVAASSLCAASAATLTGTQNSWLMVTEVAAYPGAGGEKDIGQLIEVYNNTDAELDLYDYEIAITLSRSSDLETALGAEKLRGGFYLAGEQGQSILKSGEIAVLWVVFDEAQKAYVETDVRELAAAGEGAVAIPSDTQIFRVDTTDQTAIAFGGNPYVRRDGVCYAMVNKRDGHITKSADDCGAFARIYGQVGQGRSQLYGDVGGQSNAKWQSDLTATVPASADKGTPEVDANVAMNFGTFTDTQKEVFQTISIPTKPTNSLTGTENSWLMVTEVAAYPSAEQDFGQLLEVYNNTDADLDLYDYEIAITISRDQNLEISLGAEKLRGGFYLASEPGKSILKSGELAVLWIVFDEAQKGYTEAVVRAVVASGRGAVAIPAGTQIFRIDTTDTALAFGDAPYVRRDGVCYAMVNQRGGHLTKSKDNCGAFARIYGQIGQGRSQLYGDTPHDDTGKSSPRWQADLTATAPASGDKPENDANIPMNFGTLSSPQPWIFRTVYIPDDPAKPTDPTEMIAALEAMIAEIGEVTQDNYIGKKVAIENAEAARDQLLADFDQDTLDRVSNLAALETAREKYDEYAGRASVVFGDINMDESIDASDALLALQHSVELTTLTGNALYAADVSDDQTVDASDALLILQYSVELIDHFPADENRPVGPDASVTGLGGMGSYVLSGLPTGKAVQQFAITEAQGETYIFATQREGSTAYLSRCKVASDGKSAPCVDHAVLEGYGHAESLDVSVYNNEIYLYITSDANMDSDQYYWGTTVTRLKYDAGVISDTRKITGIEYATADGSMIAEGQTAYRVNFALNDEADRMVFYFRSKNGTHTLAAYRLSVLQSKLDESAEISLKDCADGFVASTGAKKITDICPNQSFQGLAVDALGGIMVSGGTTSSKPQLTTFTVGEGTIALESTTDIDWIYSETLGTRNWADSSNYSEIESIKVYQGNRYVSFNPGTAALIKDHTEIFTLVER